MADGRGGAKEGRVQGKVGNSRGQGCSRVRLPGYVGTMALSSVPKHLAILVADRSCRQETDRFLPTLQEFATESQTTYAQPAKSRLGRVEKIDWLSLPLDHGKNSYISFVSHVSDSQRLPARVRVPPVADKPDGEHDQAGRDVPLALHQHAEQGPSTLSLPLDHHLRLASHSTGLTRPREIHGSRSHTRSGK